MYLATVGSRGDYEPFRALAEAASQAGHDVHFAHPADFAPPDSRYTEHVLPGSFEALLADGFSLIKTVASYRSVIKPMLESIYQASTDQIVALKPDVVVYHPKILTAATAAHFVGALAVIVELFPTLTPTKKFPAAGLTLSLPGALNLASYALVNGALAAFGHPGVALAKKLNVPRYQPDVTVCPVSQVIVPQPADWPSHATITGQWFTPSTPATDPELEEFLSSGPVVYAGFGSMNDGEKKAAARTRAIVDAVSTHHHKTLLVTGWGGLRPDDHHRDRADILIRQNVDHTTVFPRVDVAIHHGGAGTTHAVLRAGTPSVIMPFLADQPWWAARLAHAGLGPKPVKKTTKNPAVIAQALDDARAARHPLARAARLIAAEQGVVTALSLIERAVKTGPLS